MSNLFQRSKPELATVEDVTKAIDEITKWDWTTGYSFAHIVIDDQNLTDIDILYCLRPSWIAEVMNEKISDELGGKFDFDNLKPEQLSIYEKKVTHMAELIDLLNWLLDVPIEIRDQVR
jgi:hypothetical protein